MTATLTRTPSTTAPETTSPRSLWKPGMAAGCVAAVATVAVAAVAHACGVSFESEPGKAIPLAGFAQLTLFFTAAGVVIASVIRRRGSQPRSTYLRTTVALTALSLVPDVLYPAGVATKLTLMLTHVVAAAIVIPVICSRLPERGTR